MKNKTFDKKRQLAKSFVKQWKMTHKLTERGNYLPHSYTGEQPVLSWWDDVFFPLGSQLVVVNWTHPRMRYRDAVEDVAYEEMIKRKPHPNYDLFEESTPVYKKLGNGNRKRIIAWRLPQSTSNPALEWTNEWRQLEEEMLPKSNIVIYPSMRVRQTSWARVVDICLPIEVKNQEAIEDVASYVKGVLSGIVSFHSCYPDGYKYNCENWVQDMEYMNKMIDVHDATV
jgi:hypothetical protein